MRWKGLRHCMRLISASWMTNRLSSRVPWNWWKRGRGRRVGISAVGTRSARSGVARLRTRLFFPSCVDADCDWPIVDQINFHVHTENASAHRPGGFCLELLAEFFVTLDGYLRSGRGNKRWAVTFPSAG